MQWSFMDTAAAVSAGGRAPEEIRDLVSRVGHGKFDLVIHESPRSLGQPTMREGTQLLPIPSFAAFENTPEQQEAMSDRVRELTKGAPSHGNAGEASEFVELAHRKVRDDGTVAMVLPLSALSGSSWDGIRARWREQYKDIIIVTVAGVGNEESSFSADTGMAECLFIARRSARSNREKRATFVILEQQVKSAAAGELLAAQVRRLLEGGQVRRLEDGDAITDLRLGGDAFGVVVDASIPETGPWPLAGISDGELAKVAYHLERSTLLQIGQPNAEALDLPVAQMAKFAGRGPVHRDITEQTTGW